MTTDTMPATDIVPDTDVQPSASYTFLTAILNKDVVTLRQFGIDDKTSASIDLKTQIDVAHKLLASDNNHKRSQSKRVLAAQAGVANVKQADAKPDAKPANVTKPVAIFHQSSVTAREELAAAREASARALKAVS